MVDARERVIGIFTVDRLLGLLLPKAVRGAGLADLAFVSETLANVRERFAEVADQKIAAHVDRIEHPIHADTPLQEILLLLMRGENDLPVVDRATGRLLGMASATRLLSLIARAEG